MKARRHSRALLRRFASSRVMSVLAFLLASLFPLYGIVNAGSSIQAPAHYHSRASGDAGEIHATRIDTEDHHQDSYDVSVVSHDHDEPGAQAHHEGQHEQDATLHGVDHQHASPARHAHEHEDVHQDESITPVARHAHALDAVGVVYLDADSDNQDRGTTAKQLTLSGDALLPGWWMTAMPRLGAQVLPEPDCIFRSQVASPPLRPPSAGLRHA